MKKTKKIFSLKKSGKFYWKMEVCPHVESVCRMEYNILYDGYDGQHGGATTCLQIFLWWFILEINLPIKTDGYGKSKYREFHEPDNRKSYVEPRNPPNTYGGKRVA